MDSDYQLFLQHFKYMFSISQIFFICLAALWLDNTTHSVRHTYVHIVKAVH